MNLKDASIRTRFTVSILVMLLPILLITGVYVVSHHAIVQSLDEVIEEIAEKMHPIMNLQLLLQSASMPPHDYFIYGRKYEKEEFENLAREVDSAFEDTLKKPFELKDEQEFIRLAQKEWQKGKNLAYDIFTPHPDRGREKDLEIIERFDFHINGATKFLDETHTITMNEMDELLLRARTVKQRVYIFVAGAFLLGCGIAVITSIRLPRSILAPLRTLEKATEKLAGGDLSCRVPLNSGDEMGTLSRAFNLMAARLENSQAALEELATHDPLTDVYNRREFYHRLNGEIKRSLRYGHTFSLLILDLDNFKNVNDTYGHPVGDRVLQSIATVIRKEIRPEDTLARYGGDEFGLILPETPIANARTLAERIRTSVVARKTTVPGGKSISLGLSAGAAEFPRDGESAEKLISVADNALYAAKRSRKSEGGIRGA